MVSQEINDGKLTDMEVDVIGEVMNISMGSAATAMSTILNKKVNITTPQIELLHVNEFEFPQLEPVIGVLINYIEGIDGANVLLLKEIDMKKILSQLFGMDTSDEVEFDEIGKSAVGEIMNQMMGSAAGALASFLGKVVNISPPEILDATNKKSVRELFSVKGESLVSIKFNLTIDGLVESEFISAMEPNLAKEIVAMSLGLNDSDSDENQQEIEIPVSEPKTEVKKERLSTNVTSKPNLNQEESMITKKKQVQVASYNYKDLGDDSGKNQTINNNLDLIMSVPIEIKVELGKTRKRIKDIADLTLGNIIELDRQAGDQVDVIANGRLIAKGDVVVVDDNYSVRITEIIKVKEENQKSS